MSLVHETGPETSPTSLCDEELLQRRVDLHTNLGIISTQLSEITAQYHDCIYEILSTTGEIHKRGLDTSMIEKLTTYRPAAEPDTHPVLRVVD